MIDLDNPEFKNVWNLIQYTTRSVFMTGKAGTGKSTFLRYITENTKKKYVVLAPTGIAAVNVGGVTMHSFFRIPFKPLLPDDPDLAVDRLKQRMKFPRDHQKLLKSLDLIIIDEISMVRADVIDFMDKLLRVYTGKRFEPFGGKQLLLIGDLFQLEPVVTGDMRDILAKYYPNPFFFSARAFDGFPVIPIELKKIYRQTDHDFISMLDRIRIGRPTGADLMTLRDHVDPGAECGSDDFVMTLAARRDMVDNINDTQLGRIKAPAVTYLGEIKEIFPENALPAPMELTVKVGAQVVFVRNDYDKRWVNGTLGKVYYADSKRLEVELESGKRHVVTPELWENVEYSYDEGTHKVIEKVIGIYKQYPLRLAWALTVHKSQGLTFNKVIIDLGRGAFTSGQSYVALSRCTGLEGLRLKSPLTARDIFVNQAIVGYTSMFNNDSQINRAIQEARADELYREAAMAFNRGEMSTAVDSFIDALYCRSELRNGRVVRLLKMKLASIGGLKERITDLETQLADTRSRFDDLAREYVLMGRECLAGGEIQAAVANFEKALSISPGYVDAYLGVGEAMAESGDIDRAIAGYRQAQRYDARNYKACKALADLFLQQGELYDALNMYLSALNIDDKDSSVFNNLADLYERIGDEEEAENYRREAKRRRRRGKR
ncbi:MAG: AAA family ATPase [Clostridiales bacterium]|nr:AAA family ATPase [Clostridiales bacterium]